MAPSAPHIWTITFPDRFITWMDASPLAIHDRERHLITMDLSDTVTTFYYEPLEEDCYLFMIDIKARESAYFRMQGDRESEYFILSFQLGRGEYVKKTAFTEAKDYWAEKSLSFASVCYFFNNLFDYESTYSAGACVRTLMLCVKREWLEKNLELGPAQTGTSFMKVLNKELACMTVLDDTFYRNVLPELIQLCDQGSTTPLHNLRLRNLSLSLFSGFFSAVLQPVIPEQEDDRSDENKGINKVKDYLDTFFRQTFPGLEKLAEVGSMTVPTMRRQFKAVFGTTTFEYFNEVQMRFAFQRLSEGDSTKEIALSLGYKNTGNFTRSFKKRFQLLPSEIKRIRPDKN